MTVETMHAPLPAPERVGQATAVEMSRAVAEVYAQVELARKFPRDEDQAFERMRRTCKSLRLADRAFYKYPRGGETVTGMTIHVAVALARCWGNLLHGLAEMSRDDMHGQSEMQAFCWELEGNTRHAHTFIVQHVRRAGDKNKKLDDPRDIYENNTNNGNRRWREAIFKALPVEFVEEAEAALRARLFDAIGADSIEDGREKALGYYRSEFGLRRDQLEQKLRKPKDKWRADDLVELRILSASLKRGEIRLEDAFVSVKVTAEELAADARAPKAARPAPQRGAPAHWDHAPSEFVDGCPGCIAESTSAGPDATGESETGASA